MASLPLEALTAMFIQQVRLAFFSLQSEDVILQETLHSLTQLVGARYGGIMVNDSPGRPRRFLHTGITEEDALLIGDLPQGNGLLGIVLRTGEALRLSDITREPRALGLPPHHPRMTTLLAAPIGWRDRVLGNVYLSDKDSGELFTEQDETIVRAVGHLLGVCVAHTREVADRRRAEEAEGRLRAELARSEKLEAVGRLAAGIAHEINTPTQYVGDNTKFLQEAFGKLAPLPRKAGELVRAVHDGTLSSDLAKELQTELDAADVDYLVEEIPRAILQSLEGIERVTRIVRAIKEFSHPGGDKMKSVDLSQAIESTIMVATNEWKYVAEMEVNCDPNLPPVPCLPGELNQVFLNLVVNAAHAIEDVVGDGSRGKGKITITTRRDGDFAEIRFADTGTGIPEEAREKIFDPFFTTKTVGKGTGQGLSIVHAVVVQKHGGTIEFETEVGKGTTFVIRLPLLQIAASSPLSEQ